MKKTLTTWFWNIPLIMVVACAELGCNMRDSQFAHLPPSDYFYKRYEGKIGDKLAFCMNLNRYDSIVEGEYYYNKIGQPIHLNGKIDKNGRILLVESLNGKETGRFEGSFKTGNQEEITGDWSANGKKMSFEMQENYEKGMAQIKMENYAKSTGKCETLNSSQKGCAKIQLNSVQLVDNVPNNVKEMINNRLNELAFEGKKPENITSDFMAQYERDLQDLSPDFALIYEQSMSMKVLLNEKNMLTVQCTHYEYMGGAHGSMNHVFTHFDLQTGETISLDKLFLAQYKAEITDIAARLFKEQNNISEKQTFEDAGYWFEDNQFYLPKKFFLLRDRIVFQYEEYEIAPYAMGVQNVEIPYTLIEKFITDNSILANFLKQ